MAQVALSNPFGMTSSPGGTNPWGATRSAYSPQQQGSHQSFGPTATQNRAAMSHQRPQQASYAPQMGYQMPQAQPPAPPSDMNVQGSIQPGTLYTPQQTQQSVNLARANAAIQGNPAWLQKQYDRRGVSRSAGTLAAATPEMAQYQAMGAMAGAEIPFADAQANAQFGLQGQQAQEAEVNALSRQGLAMQNAADVNQQNNQMMMLRLLGMV